MLKTNKKWGMILAVLCIISCVTNMFNMLSLPVGLPAIVMSFAFSAFVAFIAMMQTYQHEDRHCNSHTRFWLIYSAVSGIIVIVAFCAYGFNLIENHISASIMIGLIPALMPIIGVFFGNFGRVFLKGKPAAVI